LARWPLAILARWPLAILARWPLDYNFDAKASRSAIERQLAAR